MTLHLETLSGDALLPWLPRLVGLRTAVFREWPYLYEGDAVADAAHLAEQALVPGGAFVVARDGEAAVGLATCQPLETSAPARAPFEAAGLDPATVCYFGEAVLRPEYRGRGLGVGFFAAREAHARALGRRTAAFCSVLRDTDDPRRPPGTVPLDGFWRRRGYAPRPDLVCEFRWREVGGAEAVPHRLSFWMRELAA